METLLQAAPPLITSDNMSNSYNMDTSTDADGDDMGLSQSAPNGGGEPSRSSRLARKAESARQARLRHKQYVTELQEQVAGLQSRIKNLEVQLTAQPSAAQAFQELLGALQPEHKAQLQQWLTEAQGENHIMKRVAVASATPQPLAPQPIRQPQAQLSSPITINGFSNHRASSHSTPVGTNGSAPNRHSPMESDEDTFTMSHSWDDNEAARSILNLNSPNGIHPNCSSSVAIPSHFALPSAHVASSAPTSFSTHFTSFAPRGVTSNH
mmetsp:Transcript_10626/g.22582  ORF Transcript_10626/g.22582 Transcript_10626/m.22582 type:complete len:267 (-) Transcript_10626:834-1634(-)